MTSPHAAAELAPSGAIRAAINLGNGVLTRVEADGSLGGRSVDMATAIGAALGRPVTLLRYDNAAAVLAGAAGGQWDLAFIAIDRDLADRLHFTAPYLKIEAAYLVAADAPFQAPADLDAEGLRIASAKTAAYNAHLIKTLRHAALIACDKPAEALALFTGGGADAAAGIRRSLEQFAEANPGYRVLDENLMEIGQGIATPQGRPAAAAFLDAFAANLIASERP